MFSIKQHRKLYFFVIAIMHITVADAMNMTKPYDIFVRPHHYPSKCSQLYVLAEKGFDAKGYGCSGGRINSARIWNYDQNSLKMLEGFGPDSEMYKLREDIGGNDNGTRGHFCVNSVLDSAGAGFAARFFFPHDFSLGIYLPVYHANLKRIRWCELPEEEDDPIKELLTDNFCANVYKLGCLDLGCWKKTGLGDLTFLGDWIRNFPQPRPMLKNVRLNGRFGVSCPTGLKQDEDKVLAYPFGNDGSWAMIFAGGLDVMFGSYFNAGLDVELTHLFGYTKMRRIKTNRCQTELLLLQKCMAYKDYALRQQFTLYTQLSNFYRGLSIKAGYQFFKHGEDSLSLLSNDFSTDIANTAKSLDEQTMHNFLVKISYDFVECAQRNAAVIPTISFYAKVPFNGKRAIQSTFVGLLFSVDF